MYHILPNKSHQFSQDFRPPRQKSLREGPYLDGADIIELAPQGQIHRVKIKFIFNYNQKYTLSKYYLTL